VRLISGGARTCTTPNDIDSPHGLLGGQDHQKPRSSTTVVCRPQGAGADDCSQLQLPPEPSLPQTLQAAERWSS